MGPINLEILDTPILNQTNFGADMQRWLSNIVDILNSNVTTLNEYAQNLIEAKGTNIGGSGAGPITVSVTGLTATGYVFTTLISTTNADITIDTVTPGLNGFDVTFSADPGASAIIVYQAFIAQPSS